MGESDTGAGLSRLMGRLDTGLPLRLLGFGFIYAWGICLWDIPLAASKGSVPLQGTPAWLISAILTPVACIALALWGRSRELSQRDGLPLAGALLCTGGTIALVASGYTDGWAHGALAIAAGLGTGCGPALLIVLWGCLFARVDTSVVETVVPASFAVTLLCALVIPALAAPVAAILVAVLPLASGALLVLSRNSVDHHRIPAEEPDSFEPLAISHFSVVRMMAAVFILYTLGCITPAESPVTLPASAEAYATVVGMMFAIALSVSIVLFVRRINVASLYQWITVPFVVGIMVTPLAHATTAFLARTLMNAVFTGIEIITMLYFIRLSQRTGRTATFYVGLGAAAAYGGVLAGYGIASPLRHTAASFESSVFVCLAVLGLFTLTSLLVPRRDQTLEQQPGTAAVAAHPADDPAVASSYAAEVDAVLERRRSVARKHGLSNRETEIFLLLAQGRSRPYIRDSLYLSKNTVATHIRHIYEKLGIHSQQELIDLVEG